MVLEIHAELVGPPDVLLSLKHSGIRLFDNDVKSSKYIIRHTHIHIYSMVGIYLFMCNCALCLGA